MASVQHLRAAWFPAAALCIAAGGCASSDPMDYPVETPGSDPFDCASSEGLETLLISDFEEGVAEFFYTNTDGSEGSVADPPAGTSSPGTTAIKGGRCGISERALRLTGSGFTDWGMVFGLNFEGGPINVAEWEGISFWARRGEKSGSSLFFSVTDVNTDPIGMLCEFEPPLLTDKCDAYGVGIGLEEEWRFFELPFSLLKQRGFGVITDAIDPSQAVGIGWAAGPGRWDVWVDDVAFYRRVTPTTAQ